MNNLDTKTIKDYNNLELREATQDWKLETTYCSSCGHNHYDNIGTYTCEKCGQNKAK